jgi:hypothetical protein
MIMATTMAMGAAQQQEQQLAVQQQQEQQLAVQQQQEQQLAVQQQQEQQLAVQQQQERQSHQWHYLKSPLFFINMMTIWERLRASF